MKNFFIFFIVVFLSVTSFAQQIEKQILDRNGNPTFVEFDTKSKTISKSETKDVLSNLLNATKNEEFKSFRSVKDQMGFTHERFQQYYKGIKVENGVYIVHSRNEIIESLSGEYKVIKDINTTPSITSDEAVTLAKSFVDAQKYMDKNEKDSNTPELVIVVDDYGKHPKAKREMVLAYKVDVYALKPLSRDWVYVDAHTGEIAHVNARIKNASATGNADTRYSGTKTLSTDSYNGSYRLRDYSRGNGIITYDCNTSTSYSNAVDFTDSDNTWSSAEYDNSAKDNGALDAHWAGMVTHDYFQNIHGRNSFDGSGALIKTYVHYDNQYENAFWNGSVFTFGDGASTFDILTSLDVFAHEFGHAVCSYTADLTYSSESGALNEAFSDIWGCAVEYHYAPEKDNWLMGEDIGYVLRSVSDPKSKNLPDTYLGENWATGSSDNYGVHTNNGPFCYWFYLISVGGNGTNDNNDSYDVTGIGIEKAEKIAYRIESVYMTSSSDYADSRTYAIQAAQDLYGEGSQEEISVTNAMYAIGVGDSYDGGGTTPDNYCTSKGNDASYEWISNVEIGTYSNSSDGAGYTDFTSENIELGAGESYNITLTPGFGSSSYDEYWKIWIDYNNDFSFTSDELAFDAGSLSSTDVNGTISIPAGTEGTSTRMRITMKYNGEPSACETFDYGEVEDYTVTITSGSGDDTQAPTAPTNLAASNITTTTVDLSWSASTDNVGVTEYQVLQDGSVLGTVTGTSASIDNLTPATSYTYTVKALDAAGNISAASNAVTITTEDDSQGSYCESKGNNSSYEWIAEVSIGSFTNSSGAAGYSDFTGQTVELPAGETTNLTLTPEFASSTYNEYWKIWIDYNNDYTFSSDELAFDAGSMSSSAVNGSITVPSDASGTTRMRVSMKYNGEPTACEAFSYGEVEDYTVTFTSGGGDTQAPTAPTNLSSANITTTSVDLSWSASSDNVGVTEYQVLQNGSVLGTVTGTSANVTGLTPATTYTFTVKAVDAAGNVSAASNAISVTTSEDSNVEYCSSQGNNSSYEWIDLVELGSMSNATGDDGGYANYTNLTANVAQGASQTIYVSCGFSGSSYTEYWHVWIDWNQDGTFASDELMVSGSSSSADKLSATFTVPSNALMGTTRMRVTMKYNAEATACETFSYGEVEDYTINVTSTSASYFATSMNSAEELGNEMPTSVELYPVPANNYITVAINNGTKVGTISIYSATGSLVKVADIDGAQKELDISDLPAGSYIISVEDEKEPITKGFIKR